MAMGPPVRFLLQATTRSRYGIKSHVHTKFDDRAPRGQRRSYEPEHAQRLRFIRRSRELGFGIDAIRRLIALSEPGVQACCEVRDMAQDHIANVDAKIADLQRLRTVLRQAVADCSEGGRVRCPVIEELGSS